MAKDEHGISVPMMLTCSSKNRVSEEVKINMHVNVFTKGEERIECGET
jgi:hypothetical protein